MQIQNFGAARTMSSREIAELTEKNHADVLRDIRNMLEQLREDVSRFAANSPDSYGRPQPLFNLPEDFTITLVSGYSVQMRHRIVKRWQELERSCAPALPQTFAAALRLAAEQQEQIEQQAAALVLAAPKVEALDRLSGADGSLCLTEAAKVLVTGKGLARLAKLLGGVA